MSSQYKSLTINLRQSHIGEEQRNWILEVLIQYLGLKRQHNKNFQFNNRTVWKRHQTRNQRDILTPIQLHPKNKKRNQNSQQKNWRRKKNSQLKRPIAKTKHLQQFSPYKQWLTKRNSKINPVDQWDIWK